MKALAIKQPWTSLICAGLKTTENRTWKTSYRGKLLLVASKQPVSLRSLDDFPAEWYDQIVNNIAFGNLPSLDTLPNSAVIGFADLVDCDDNQDHFANDIWYTGAVGWKLENICIFDEPQLQGIKSKLNVFDIEEIDENNLPPYHKAEPRYPHFEGTELVVPYTDADLEAVLDVKVLAMYYFDDRLQLELTGELDGQELKPCKTIRIETPTRTVRFEVNDAYVAQLLDDNGELQTVPSLFHSDEVPDFIFKFELGKQL